MVKWLDLRVVLSLKQIVEIGKFIDFFIHMYFDLGKKNDGEKMKDIINTLLTNLCILYVARDLDKILGFETK